jgi:hypothetical protein
VESREATSFAKACHEDRQRQKARNGTVLAQNSELDATRTAGNACLKDRQFSWSLRRIFNDLEGAVFDAPVAPLCWRGLTGFVAARSRAAQEARETPEPLSSIKDSF